ncbi:MAG TPA: DUF485 domain-containing protein [Solirubrobacteraceae bacterium]|nr:DUF485 domain-containing protein [Solirubrobacteraceae bacterium]
MSSPTARADQASASATGSPGTAFDWRGIESSPEFRELVASKRRFIVPAAVAVFAIFLGYLLLATFAEGFMGSEIVDGLPVAWALAVSQVVMTWVVTWLYLRKADREWEPLERRAAERAAATVEAAQSPSGDRFVR